MIKRGAYFEAIAVLIGTVIGAGILGIPFVIAHAGFITGLITIVIVGAVITTTNVFLGEIVTRTKGNHQLTGYAFRYLGKWGKELMALSMIFGLYGALIAFLIGEGTALSAIFGGSPFYWSIGFFIVFSGLLYVGLQIIKHSEFFLVLILLFIALVIIFISAGQINMANLTSLKPALFFAPYGVILFAYLGLAAIPEMKEILFKKSNLTKATLVGSLIVTAIYVLFSLAVVGVCGTNTSQIATICLGSALGTKMVIFGNLFAIFAMATSYLASGLALQEMYSYDYKMKKMKAWALTAFVPLIFFLAGVKNFIVTLQLTGALTGGVAGILIALMYRNLKKNKLTKKQSTVTYLIMITFAGGIVYTLINL